MTRTRDEVALADTRLDELRAARDDAARQVSRMEARDRALAELYEAWRQGFGTDAHPVDDRDYPGAYRLVRERAALTVRIIELTVLVHEIDTEIARRLMPPPSHEPVVSVAEPPPLVLVRPPTRRRGHGRLARRLVFAGAGALVVIAAAVAALALVRGDEPVSVSIAPPAVVTVPTVEWANTTPRAKPSRASCTWRPRVTIAGGRRYTGRRAVVMLYGPDFPQRPTKTVIVDRAGTASIGTRLKSCANVNRDRIALVSVDGNGNVAPRPPR